MRRKLLLLGALLAFLGVLAGAFGTHGLRGSVEPRLLEAYETGARYHLFHAIGLLALAGAAAWLPARALGWVAGLHTAGVVLFSGSLYALALTGQTWLGAVTPLGGAAFLAGWLVLAAATFRTREEAPRPG
jgi:uncharacterized membrane protein YgdD (TMEM256/DUF423 family)